MELCESTWCWCRDAPKKTSWGHENEEIVINRGDPSCVGASDPHSIPPHIVVLCDLCLRNCDSTYRKSCHICGRFMYDTWITEPVPICRVCVDDTHISEQLDDETFEALSDIESFFEHWEKNKDPRIGKAIQDAIRWVQE